MFKQEELQILLAFLDRVSLNGKEAETLVYLKNKIRGGLNPAEQGEVPKKRKGGKS